MVRLFYDTYTGSDPWLCVCWCGVGLPSGGPPPSGCMQAQHWTPSIMGRLLTHRVCSRCSHQRGLGPLSGRVSLSVAWLHVSGVGLQSATRRGWCRACCVCGGPGCCTLLGHCVGVNATRASSGTRHNNATCVGGPSGRLPLFHRAIHTVPCLSCDPRLLQQSGMTVALLPIAADCPRGALWPVCLQTFGTHKHLLRIPAVLPPSPRPWTTVAVSPLWTSRQGLHVNREKNCNKGEQRQHGQRHRLEPTDPMRGSTERNAALGQRRGGPTNGV